jgi:hypothetical protein
VTMRLVRDLAIAGLVVIAGMAAPADPSVAAASPGSRVHAAVTSGPWSNTHGLTTIMSLGGQARGHAAIAARTAGYFDVFVRGLDGSLWHDGGPGSSLGWTGWQALGGRLISSPAAASWGLERLDVFAVGLDRALWHIDWTGSTWSPWQSLGGGFISGPTVSSWTPNVLDVEGVGLDHALWHSRWDGSRWSAWESLGGYLTSDPAGISPPANVGFDRIDVFGRGLDGQMWQNTRVGGSSSTWDGWFPVGGAFNSGPGVTNTSTGLLLMGLGLDWNVWCNELNGSGWKFEPIWGTHADPALPTTGVDVVAICLVMNDATVEVVNIVPQVPLTVHC